ncbi:FAD-dependent oxidoreductase [Anabaena lutea]|uniref:2-polyprenyl-6-methoxyphenol hydroxylase-like oxidoreductase n=1 Tax=Anabaena lutea FACHB-196 TaxID=2692881 RepID=A0ABR8FDP9_9NOST|nr:FAD-dependent monooxygenase [Anabaena lutea]MBD2568340.1 2-polyprenyl-6-methoxyphenol hydroxylase-like oxidoreductase [Anabaena lutea FACHB-196]
MGSANSCIATEKTAVVMGGSIAGMLTAQVLTKHFDRVIIVERDLLKEAAEQTEQRPGVPQSFHAHALLMRGQQILEYLFPGIVTELADSDASVINWTADCLWLSIRGWVPRFDSQLITRTCSRNLLEWTIRKRLTANERVEWRSATQVTGLLTNQVSVTGVRIRTANEPEVEIFADVVVDATGRNSRTPHWLQAMGYEPPQETVVNSFLGYASRWYEIPADLQKDWNAVYITTQAPGTRGGVIYQVEGNRWIITLVGVGRDYPPTDEAGFLEFARSLRSPIIYETIKKIQPLSPIYAYKRTENCLHHYEKLSRFPENFLVVGDAVCSFNPVYGQGMTTAALGAMTLDECLSQQGNLIGLSRRFQKQLNKVISVPWMIATGEDFRWSTTEGGQTSLINKLMQKYLEQVLMLQSQSPEVHQLFLEVMHMQKQPRAFFHPRILMQVLKQIFTSQGQGENLTNGESLATSLPAVVE